MSTIKANAVTGSTTNSDLALTGSGSGVVKIGDGALKFPDADGTTGYFIKTDGSAQLSFAEAGGGGFTLGTEQATTSGTSVTFGSIPSGTTIIVIMFEDVTQNSNTDVTIGDAGGLEISGYKSGSTNTDQAYTESTAEFIVNNASANYDVHGIMVLTLKDSSNFTWIASHTLYAFNPAYTGSTYIGGGTKSLSAELTQVSISGGTYEGGSINIMYQ